MRNLILCKFFILYVLSLLVWTKLPAQTSFEILFQTNDRASIGGGIETADGHYVFVINNLGYIPEYSHPFIIKADASGNILQYRVLKIKDAIRLGSIFYDQYSESIYIIGIVASYPDLIHDSLLLSKWTTDLDLVDYSFIECPFEGQNALSAAIRNDDGNFIISGVSSPPTLMGFTLMLDNDFNLISQQKMKFFSMFSSIGQFNFQETSGYLFAFLGQPPGFELFGEYIMKTDEFLNILKFHPITWPFDAGSFCCGNTFIINYSDNMFIASGRYWNFQNPPYNQRDMGVLKFDHSSNIVNSNILGKPGDTIDFPGFKSGIAIVDADNIYAGGTSNINILQHPYAPTPSWFMLNKLDGDLNLQWQKFYGGDAYYSLFSIFPTSDGGCVMMGTRYHPGNPTGIDAYILKVGPDGLVSVPELESGLQAREVILYPNPGTSQLHIQTGHQDLEVRFYNANGSLHFKEKVNRFSHTVNTATWPAGTYFYQIAKGTEIIDSGKWLKAE